MADLKGRVLSRIEEWHFCYLKDQNYQYIEVQRVRIISLSLFIGLKLDFIAVSIQNSQFNSQQTNVS